MRISPHIKTAVACFVAALTFITPRGALTAGDEMVIVYTNSLNGYLDYCHCKEEPKGGLVKRATAVRTLREKYPELILVETGDIFASDEDHLLAGYIIRAYRQIGYDALAPGDQDFINGMDFFLKIGRELPLVCNNVTLRHKGATVPAGKRYLLVKRGQRTIGIIGTMHREAFKYYPSSLTKSVVISEQAAEIRRDVEALKRQGADIIILLSHSGYENDLALSGMITDVDIIVGGHSQTLLKKPVIKNGTAIVQAGANGAHIGILRFSVKNGNVVDIRNSFLLPDDSQPEDDPAIRRLIGEYEREVKEKYRKLRLN